VSRLVGLDSINKTAVLGSGLPLHPESSKKHAAAVANKTLRL
jgi:hypothetical protein